MSTPKMMPINFAAAKSSVPDVDDLMGKVTEIARKTNVPKLIHPADASPAAEPAAESKEPPVTSFRRFTVELPLYLIEDIEQRAKGKTRRYIAMKAFKDAGFFVADADMKEDFRGRRS